MHRDENRMGSSLHHCPRVRHDFLTGENLGNTGGNLVASPLDFMEMSSFETRINVRLDAFDKFLSQVRPMSCWQKKGFLKKLIYGCWHGQILPHDQHHGNSRKRMAPGLLGR